MRGVILCLTLFTLSLCAANLKLYTTDGDYQLVREYQVNGDRVKFYSVDRGEWEEVPLSLVDIKRTESESSVRKAIADRQDKASAEEASAVREERTQLAQIPKDSGVYRIENGAVRTLPVADSTVHTPKGRSILQVLSPLPVIEGKATVEIAGSFSQNIVREERPEFFFRMDRQESFAIVKLTTQKSVRVVEHIEIMPISKETTETRESIPIFSKQLPGEDFYKIWPQETLPKGEYAVIEYLDGKVDLRVWDFRIE